MSQGLHYVISTKSHDQKTVPVHIHKGSCMELHDWPVSCAWQLVCKSQNRNPFHTKQASYTEKEPDYPLFDL